jgi:hypothetical protein
MFIKLFASLLIGLFSMNLLHAGAFGMYKDESDKPAFQKGGAFGIKKQSDVLVQDAKVFGDAKEVYIGGFKVGFLNYSKARAHAGGGPFSNVSRASLSTVAELDGVSEKEYQAITDAAYANFKKTLEDQGYIVKDRSELEQFKSFKKVNADESGSLAQLGQGCDERVVFYAPTGMPVHFHLADGVSSAAIKKIPGMPVLPGVGGIKGGIGNNSPSAAYAKTAHEEKTNILNATYYVDFVNESGTNNSHSSYASLSVAPGLSVKPGSYVQLIKDYSGTFQKGAGQVALGQSIYTKERFSAPIENTTSKAKVAANVFNVGVAVLTGGAKSTGKNYSIKAKPDAYTSLSTKLLEQTNLALIGEMAKHRDSAAE